MKKSKFYGAGKHRSVAWWKEMGENLIAQGFLQQISLKGRFAMQVTKVTRDGLAWANMADLNGLLDGMNINKLDIMTMTTPI